jgi:hypothetical protein
MLDAVVGIFFLIPTFVFLVLACGRQVCNAFLKENLVLIGLKNPYSTKVGILGKLSGSTCPEYREPSGKFHQPAPNFTLFIKDISGSTG